MQKKVFFKNTGFSLVEILLAIFLFGLLATAITGVIIYSQQASLKAADRARASRLAEEGIEAARNIRDSGFGNLTAGTYGLSASGGVWSLSGSSDSSGIFTRQVSVSDVSTSTKDVTVTVTWNASTQNSGAVSLLSRFTNWRGQ